MGAQIRGAPKQKPQRCFTPAVPGKGILQRCPLCAHMLRLPQFPFANYWPERRKCPLWIKTEVVREPVSLPIPRIKRSKTQDSPIPSARCKNKDAPSHLCAPDTRAKHPQNSRRAPPSGSSRSLPLDSLSPGHSHFREEPRR